MECINYQLKTTVIEYENIENLKPTDNSTVSLSVKSYQFTVKYQGVFLMHYEVFRIAMSVFPLSVTS